MLDAEKGLSAEEYKMQLDAIETRRVKAVEDVEARWKLKQMDEEGKLRTRLAKREQEQKEALKEAQLEQK